MNSQQIDPVWDIIDKVGVAMLTTRFGGGLRDTARAAEIWKSTDQVWWPGGPDDPALRVLRVEPKTAELRDEPSSLAVAAFEFAKAKVTRAKPNLGENR